MAEPYDPSGAFDPYEKIPLRQLEALALYIEQGYQPGNFLTAVLSNDLKGAVARADEESKELLPLYVQWLYNRAPYSCWGSPEQVEKWVAGKRAARHLGISDE